MLGHIIEMAAKFPDLLSVFYDDTGSFPLSHTKFFHHPVSFFQRRPNLAKIKILGIYRLCLYCFHMVTSILMYELERAKARKIVTLLFNTCL